MSNHFSSNENSQSDFDSGDEHFQKLKSPRFDLIEEHFRCKVPESLRALYSNHKEIVRTDIYIKVKSSFGEMRELYIQAYDPIDENVLISFPGREKYINFACCIGPYIYMIDPTLTDPEVCLYSVEGTTDQFEPLGITLSEFISAPRRYADDF